MKYNAAGENIEASSGGSQVAAALAALTPPGADRIFFWDFSAGTAAFLTPGAGVTISGTTLNISGGFAPQLGFLNW